MKNHFVSKIVLTFHTVQINFSNDLKKIANFWPSTSNLKSFSQLLEQFFLTESQYNFGNKIIPSLSLIWILSLKITKIYKWNRPIRNNFLGISVQFLVQFLLASRKVYNEVFPFNSFPTARKISFPHPDKLLHEFWQ